MSDRYSRIALTILAAASLAIAVRLWVDRPVTHGDWSRLKNIADPQERAEAADKLLARTPTVYVRDGLVTIDNVQSTVDVNIEGGFVTVDGAVSIDR